MPYGLEGVSKVSIIGGRGVNKVKAPPLGDRRRGSQGFGRFPESGAVAWSAEAVAFFLAEAPEDLEFISLVYWRLAAAQALNLLRQSWPYVH